MRKILFLFVLLSTLVFFLFLFKTPVADSLNLPVSTTIDPLALTNNSPSTIENEYSALDHLITLDDLLLINHPILSTTPMLLTTTQALIEDFVFSIKTFKSYGSNSFIYTLFSSPDISYVCVNSSLDLTYPPTYFIVTSDKYTLSSNLKVGLSKEDALNLYKSHLPCESFEWDYTMSGILESIVSYDEIYCFYGTVTSEESKKYGMESFSLAPSGLCIFLENGKVVAFSNVIPGAN